MNDYKISIPFSAFLTANSILIAADFVFLQLWLNFQEPNCKTQWEAVGIAAIFVSYFVILSIISMILAILDRGKYCRDEVKGLPVILFFYSLGFTMVFVFQSIVTHTIKIFCHIPINNTLYQHVNLLYFYIIFVIALIVTILIVAIPKWWDKLFKCFRYHHIVLILAILGIFAIIIGVELFFAKEYIFISSLISPPVPLK